MQTTSPFSFRAVFNWKDKKVLRLELKASKKAAKLRPVGDFSDIKHLFDLSDGATMTKLTGESTFSSPARPIVVENINDNKQVNVTMLYGSNKNCGLLQKKENLGKLKFSHGRIFGVTKSNRIVEDSKVAQ
jgi:hypothetical protein